MATVYLARDLKHQRQVALKVLRPELAAALGPERFLREIALTAALHHPPILPLLDSGTFTAPGESIAQSPNRDRAPLGSASARPGGKGVPRGPIVEHLFYTMPFVTGGSLRDRLDCDKQLPIEDALRIACEAAAELRHSWVSLTLRNPASDALHNEPRFKALVAWVFQQ